MAIGGAGAALAPAAGPPLDPAAADSGPAPLGPSTLKAAAFAFLFASGASVLAEVWREARILRPLRPPVPAPVPSPPPPPSSLERLEKAVDDFTAKEARLAVRLRSSAGNKDQADLLRERLKEARVVKAALVRELELERRQQKGRRRRDGTAAA